VTAVAVRRDKVDLVATLLLAVATVATAWSGYQSTRWMEVDIMSELTRRDLLIRGTSAAAAAAAAGYALRGPARTLLPGTARAATTTAWNHDPASPIGPLHWGGIDPSFSVCGSGASQSPVDIRTARLGSLHGPPLVLTYDESELAIENTGHVVEVMIPPGVEDVLRIGGDRYTLSQYHFHALSEHTVNGRHADVEAHLVHTSAAGDTAVVGVLFTVGPKPNPLLETILRHAPEASGQEGEPMSKSTFFVADAKYVFIDLDTWGWAC
jgi:carbonic anhydrase